MSEERLAFQAEVSRLLKLMVNSVYSDKEVFLRELISNASDACDKLRYEALTAPELAAEDADYQIRVIVDAKAKTIEVADNGIGMNRDELIQELGTIARSGTNAFLEQMTDDQGSISLSGVAEATQEFDNQLVRVMIIAGVDCEGNTLLFGNVFRL